MNDDTWFQRNKLPVLVVTFAVMLVALPLISQYWLAPTIFEQNRQAGQDIAENSMDSEQAIQEYREFRTLWYDIESAREQLENYKQEEEQFHETYGNDPSEWSRTAEERHGQIHTRITGQRNQVSNLVSEYNAKTDDATRAIFACGLPWSVDEKLYIADASGVEYTSQEAMNKTPPEDPSECKFSEAPDGSSNTTN